ncbi:Exo-beta-1,3-glucanase [Neohortaea acidophila]|uniref:Exo-beta-1,3-glucanase n=1 Tax=Neohortaea acidophila TaxID=245834 RepID=A0A6A6PG00_9PEZI|nr:Exo-beta-1,3-glucanase [Neohortaea acidophila]KAF2478654.1 Exo-beta-1,3-glucanase [Neohortaea acidophila]
MASFASNSGSSAADQMGRYILDANGERIKLVSVNWYGGSDVFFVPMGLETRHRKEIAQTIRDMGFNSVRLPYSDQMVIQNPVIDPVHLGANLDLLDGHNEDNETGELSGPRALDVFQACVEALTDAGIAVIINDHITNAHWCDGMNLCDASWKNDHLGPLCSIRQTTQSWIENWKTVMAPHVDNPLVIGADLRNEPRGLWGTMTWDALASASEQASEALLAMQPNWLMFFEGVSSANDVSGARARPIKLSIPNRVVYSSHVYAWSGWGSGVPFGRRAYASFAAEMHRNWGYLLAEDIAPVWVGEFGNGRNMGPEDLHYWKNLMRYLADSDADWGYWALNPWKPGQIDETYGLLKKDWKTPRDDVRLEDLRNLMGSAIQ